MFFKSTNAIIYFVLSTLGGRRTDADEGTPTPDYLAARLFLFKSVARRLASRRAVPWPRGFTHIKYTAEQKKRENRYRIISESRRSLARSLRSFRSSVRSFRRRETYRHALLLGRRRLLGTEDASPLSDEIK